MAFFRDFSAGTIGGMFGIFCGQPFDTMKVRMQVMKEFVGKSTQHAISSTLRQEGFLSFYRGMAFPLYSACLVNAVVFSVEGSADRQLRAVIGDEWKRTSGFVAGCIAGFIQTPIITAAELAKCQLQVETGAKSRPWVVMRERVNTLGFSQGCFQGMGVCAWRESPSYGIYFLVYGSMGEVLKPLPQALSTVLSGGIAGMVAMGTVHPFDVVKTEVQALPKDASPEERSARWVAARGYAQEGWRFFARGLFPAQLRAFTVNAGVFSGYESAMYIMRNYT
eukprot:gnl/MRDRNA2_/MRDRNA2_69852_c0_seq1.p1 gnl/MRDRNA2_/MRDRNA2_69852_c0~~gnl/MRDRNA2_/MRDRNA2_69852_c0_seq1.p1  ORF type:complete len:326 (+),score=50.51 gnl/MRDRNA2_/MRDRNA2_69852_c0_seq1:142-978(+)